MPCRYSFARTREGRGVRLLNSTLHWSALGAIAAMKPFCTLITIWNKSNRLCRGSSRRHDSPLEWVDQLTAILPPDHPDRPTRRYGLEWIKANSGNSHSASCAWNESHTK